MNFPIKFLFQIQNLRKNILKSNFIDIPELMCVELNHLVNYEELSVKNQNSKKNQRHERNGTIVWYVKLLLSTICLFSYGVINLTSIRCLIPNNYLIYEASRPISNCTFCANVKGPKILSNPSEFSEFVYLPAPIIIKNAFPHWPEHRILTFQYLKDLYNEWPDALGRFNDECQFLPFKTSFKELKEFFDMPEDQVNSGNWYVGFSNCNAIILNQLRKLYPRPHFLPIDAEVPNADWIHMGYSEGAVMHVSVPKYQIEKVNIGPIIFFGQKLDYIGRLMWQGQLEGNKTWHVRPTPECDSVCSSFDFYVESGDCLLMDTRHYYHSTSVVSGQFSITIQSEYG